MLSTGDLVNWSEFVVSEWFWAAGAVAVAVAALIGSLATFVGGAISRRRNRPEPEWDIRFDKPYAMTELRGFVGNKVLGTITNIGDGTAFQARVSQPDGTPAQLSVDGNGGLEVAPVLRTGDSMLFVIATDLDVWDNADSILSWVDPPTRRRKGGSRKLSPHLHHPQPVVTYMSELFDPISREKWLALREAVLRSQG